MIAAVLSVAGAVLWTILEVRQAYRNNALIRASKARNYSRADYLLRLGADANSYQPLRLFMPTSPLEMIRRLRALAASGQPDPAAQEALHSVIELTINGVSGGIKNTG